MGKLFNKRGDDQMLEGGIGGAGGVGGTKWSNLPSVKSNASALDDIKKLSADTSNLRGAAKEAAAEAKGRAATRTAVRAGAAGAAGSALDKSESKASARSSDNESDEDRSFNEMSRALRETDADIEASKYGKPYKSGGKVTASSRADGIAKRGKTRGRMC